MSTVTIQDAQSRLGEIIAGLKPGDTVEITFDGSPLASLTRANGHARKSRVPGSAVGKLQILADDDEHLQDFREYMP